MNGNLMSGNISCLFNFSQFSFRKPFLNSLSHFLEKCKHSSHKFRTSFFSVLPLEKYSLLLCNLTKNDRKIQSMPHKEKIIKFFDACNIDQVEVFSFYQKKKKKITKRYKQWSFVKYIE